jgi:Carboxypeptidase regulatory-like domain/TonB dependent receptor-like, beta-barrel
VAAPSIKMTRRLICRRGRGGSFKQPLIFLTSTTPSAPFKGGFAAFLNGAATPPQLRRGVLAGAKVLVHKTLVPFGLLLCFLWFVPFLVAAPAIISGRVSDPNGKPISGASVRVQSEDGRKTDLVTDNRGTFRAEITGRFHLEIRKVGYRTVRSSTVSLSAVSDDVYQIDDIRLLPGNLEAVETVVLQLGEVASPETRGEPTVRESLPKSDRLFGLRGGVNVTNIREGSGQQWLAASGSVFTSSSMSTTVAGTSDFSAELGDTGVTNDALPAGDSSFHGNVHYFHRNDVLNAKNFFDPPDAPIPPFKYHFFGADSGGMIRNKSYFYSEYWGLRIRQSITRAATVPNPILLTGNFSSISDPIIDPETGFPFPGNRIPANRLSPQGLALARLYPAPNVSGATVQNYRAVGTLETAADAFGFRFDHRISSADEAFAEYQFNRDTTDDPFNLLSGITNLPSFGVHDALQTHTFRFHNTHVFSPSVIDQLRFTTAYLKQPRTIFGDQSAALPAIIMTSFSNLGHATNLPQERRNRSFEMLNDVSWQHSSSTTKFGGVFRYLPFHASLDLYSRGQYQFTGGIFTGNALANLLLGLPTNALRLTGDTTRSFGTSTASLYVQHEWRPRANLSVNAGLRYDYQTPFHESNDLVSNFNSTTGHVVVSPKSLYDADLNNFGPRLAVAWQPVSALVARAGYGIFYDTLAVGDSLFLLGLNPPFVHFDVKNNSAVLPEFDLATAFKATSPSVQPSIFSTSVKLPNPYLQQWSASIEYPVRKLLLVSVSYFGQKGKRLRRQLNVNQPSAGPSSSSDERRPFSEFKNIFQFETSASSIAHAAELRAERRFQSGFAFSGTYRFSRSIDDATLISILPQDSHNLAAERGLSDFHMKHRFVFSGTYSLPGRRFAFTRGWQLQAAGTLQSGTPLSAIVSADVSGTGSPIVNRPNLVGNPNIPNPTASHFFNTAAFRIPEPGTFGNSGRNVIIGPGIRNVDLAMARSIRVSDTTRAQFRADFYNVFNNTNFVAPPTMQNFADSSDFGALFVARSPRIVQLGLKFLW